MRFLIAILGVCASSCVSLKSISSGQVGCPDSEITILEKKPQWLAYTWVAECRGHRYFCSGQNSNNNVLSDVSCKEEIESTPQGSVSSESTGEKISPTSPSVTTPSGAGCTYDTQCKDDRICVDGRCTWSPETPSHETASEPGDEPPEVEEPSS